MTDSSRKLADALAFFQLFRQTDWASCALTAGDLAFFASRRDGDINPLLGAAVAGPLAQADSVVLKAPHLGTLSRLPAVGSAVAAGQAYAALTLLDETIDLIAEASGVVAEQLCGAGALAEYDQPLVRLLTD